MADIWLVNGIPGAGKTSVARELASRMTRGAHIDGDVLHDMIATGRVDFDGEPSEEAIRQVDLTDRNQCVLALSFAAAGFVPVIDFVVHTSARLQSYRSLLCDRALYLVTLAPGQETAVARKPSVARWSNLELEIEAHLGGIGLWVNNATLSVEETVGHILESRHAAVLRAGGQKHRRMRCDPGA